MAKNQLSRCIYCNGEMRVGYNVERYTYYIKCRQCGAELSTGRAVHWAAVDDYNRLAAATKT